MVILQQVLLCDVFVLHTRVPKAQVKGGSRASAMGGGHSSPGSDPTRVSVWGRRCICSSLRVL